MPSDHIAATRANAAKSKGPASPEGRQKSSQNSLRPGILARAVMPYGEAPQRFILLLDRLRDHFNPQTIVESTLEAMEKASIAHEIRRQSTPSEDENSNQDDATRAALTFLAIIDQSRSLNMMNRKDARDARPYNHSFARLIRLREKHVSSVRTQFSSNLDRLDFKAHFSKNRKKPNKITKT